MLVTVITPTTIDRERFNERIRSIVALQDYPHIEHLFDYDDGNIGTKRNRLCERANGGIIVHLDSDDIYAPDWVSRSVSALMASGKQVVGLSAFYLSDGSKTWKYTYPHDENIVGGTFCYYKSYWDRRRFLSMQVGEDNEFVRGVDFGVHGYIDGFLATIHAGNTSPKAVEACERYEEVEKVTIAI